MMYPVSVSVSIFFFFLCLFLLADKQELSPTVMVGSMVVWVVHRMDTRWVGKWG